MPRPLAASALRASGVPSGRSRLGSQNPASHSAKTDAAGSPRQSAAEYADQALAISRALTVSDRVNGVTVFVIEIPLEVPHGVIPKDDGSRQVIAGHRTTRLIASARNDSGTRCDGA